jgi:hypothetical protein
MHSGHHEIMVPPSVFLGLQFGSQFGCLDERSGPFIENLTKAVAKLIFKVSSDYITSSDPLRLGFVISFLLVRSSS